MSGAGAALAPIAAADLRAAARRLARVVHRTPVVTSRTLDERVRARVFLKAENLQRGGAFKLRGAYNRIATLDEEGRRRGVVASSSGNHAQAVALAARLLGTHATILMPEDSAPLKLAATRGYGAEVIPFDRYEDDREELTRREAERRGATLVHAYDDPLVMAGAGTCALELFEDVGELDALLVCVGGGGLIAGCATAAAELAPACRIIGVEPEAGDDVRRSLHAGRRIAVPVPRTIADGQQTAMPGALTFEVIRRLVDDVVVVSDAEIVAAMRFLFERTKLVAEPSGASALAALLAGRVDLAGLRVGVTLSGGNIDAARFASLVAGQVPGPD